MNSIKIRKELISLIDKWENTDDFTFIEPLGFEFWTCLRSLHSCNYYQWLLEDEVRKELPNDMLIQIKKKIDASNFARNRYMEYIDEYIVDKYNINQSVDYKAKWLNSETIGQLCDRLSILSLKSYFISKNLSESNNIQSKVNQIERQILFISFCYDEFLTKIETGQAFMISYKQYKTYNKSKI